MFYCVVNKSLYHSIYVCSFCRDQIFMDFVNFLFMIIYKVLIFAALFFDKTISNCKPGVGLVSSIDPVWNVSMYVCVCDRARGY